MGITDNVFAVGRSIITASEQLESHIKTIYGIDVQVCITTSSTVGGTVLQLTKDGIEIFRGSIPGNADQRKELEKKINAELAKHRDIEKMLN